MKICPFCHKEHEELSGICGACNGRTKEIIKEFPKSEFLANFNILVLGGGSIGKRQIGNFLMLGVKPEQIALVDPREDRRNQIKDIYGLTKLYASEDEAYSKEKYKAVLVSTPTAMHIPQGMKALENDCHIFMEKAISHTAEGVEEFLKKAEEKGKIILVGYTYRFWPPLNKAKQLIDNGVIGKVLSVRSEFSEYLPDWHPWEVEQVDGKPHPKFYMSSKALGGGELLDESHVIDYVRWFFGEVKEVSAFVGKVSDIVMDTDDYSQIIAVFENGLVGNIHLDCFGRNHRKQMDILGSKGNIYWDFYADTLKIYHGEEKRWEEIKFDCQRNDMFLDECRHFLACVDGSEAPIISGKDAYKTLKVCLGAINSWKERRFQAINNG